MKKVLITDYVHDDLIDGLSQLGYQVTYKKNITLAEVTAGIHDYEGIIINSKIKMFKDLIDQAVKLKFIGRLGSGLEIIDLNYAKEKGIAVFNSPEGNRNAVAEHALGMLLAFANKIVSGHNNINTPKWDREAHRGFELSGKKLGIIGFGNTGRAFANVLRGLDIEILAYDKYLDPGYSQDMDFVQETDLSTLLQQAQIISLHLPLTEETKHLVNSQFISKCREGIILINTSRGNVIDTAALLDGLASDKVKGACLDVFENEKPYTYNEAERSMYSTLFKHPNILCSPHVAGWTKESLEKIANTLIYKIKKYEH